MTMNAKLLIAALGLLAVAATPAAAATRTHHVRSHIVRVAPRVPGWQGAYGYQGAYPYQRNYLVGAHAAMDGFQHDRQMVGVGY